MDAAWAKDFITLYGPLGLGWVFAIYLFVENRKLVERLLESHHGLKAVTDQLTSLSNTVLLLVGNPVQRRQIGQERERERVDS